ncbi:MAG: type II toxin-antitoxin system RelE/ParE family toxin [Sphingobacteriales bacterium]|nr:type II toxin-antitoxin system RelE/ParE family toxin [Sphingobacteriales bacterium]
MSLKILFTDEASEMLVSVVAFIENKWGENTAKKFLDSAYQTFETVARQPYLFKASSLGKDIRIGLINKNCSFYYQVTDKNIIILFLWDNRQKASS